MNETLLQSIIKHYAKIAKTLSVSYHPRGNVTPYMKVKNKVNWKEGVVLTGAMGEYPRGYSKETFYMNFIPLPLATGLLESDKGLIVIPSITQPLRCYAFLHSHPYYNAPICFYQLLYSLANNIWAKPTKVVAHLSKYHTSSEGLEYKGRVLRNFRIEFFYGFEHSKEGLDILRLYNYRQNASSYYLKQVIYAIEEVQQWSGNTYVRISEL